jgi:3-oxoacyl-(acyl-carrier-protein) synthase
MTAQVAITGIGAVSPNGVGREVFWRNCLEGISGVEDFRFDADGWRCGSLQSERPDLIVGGSQG